MKKTMFLAAAAMLLSLGFPATAIAGGACRGEGLVKEAKATRITMAGVCFSPAIAWAAPGSTITWVNDDGNEHNVAGPGLTINSDQMMPGKSYAMSFPSAGVYPYACSVHYGMAGVIVVGAPTAPATVSNVAPPVDLPSAKPAAASTKPEPSTGTVALTALITAAVAMAVGFSAGRLRRTARSSAQEVALSQTALPRQLQ